MSKATLHILILAMSLMLTVDASAETVVTRVSDQKNVTLSQLVSDARRSDLVLIGEAHDDKTHHAMELSLISALCAPKSPFAIGLEMIQADSQPVLDDWTAGKLSEQEFQKVYARNWSFDWTLYRDIFLYARDHHIPMVGLNISKELVAKVSHLGFASLTPKERQELPEGATCDLNNPHTALLKSSFQELFKHATNGRVFTYFCEAQTLRNSGMAMNIARYVKKYPGRKVIVLAGVWHAVKNAIPEQLKRGGSTLTNTVILPEIAELNAKNATPEVADYLIGR